ncbi:MAG TPA: hypothetical protein H9667_07545 [Firmicutes bacterium]|nr:hypothetical protein [Bacillota bacterium]
MENIERVVRVAKKIIFVLGLCLLNFVTGIPYDSQNLFISHTIFLIPYLVDLLPLYLIKFEQLWLKCIVSGVFWIGIIVFVLNMLGVMEVILITDAQFVVFSGNFLLNFGLSVKVQAYLLFLTCIYVLVFAVGMFFNPQKQMQVSTDKAA